MHEWSTNHISLNKSRPRCYVKSPIAQDVFRPIPGLISCAGVTGRWRLLSHAQHVVRWLALSKRSGRSSYILHTACTLHLGPKPLLCIHVIKLNCWNTWSVGRPRRLRRPRSSLHCSPLHGALPYNVHLSWRDYTTVTVKWLPPQNLSTYTHPPSKGFTCHECAFRKLNVLVSSYTCSNSL